MESSSSSERQLTNMSGRDAGHLQEEGPVTVKPRPSKARGLGVRVTGFLAEFGLTARGGYDLRMMKALDRQSWGERLIRLVCFVVLGAAIWVQSAIWTPLVWTPIYFGTLAFNSWVLRRVPDRIGGRGLLGLALLLFLDSAIYVAIAVFFWGQLGLLYPTIAVIMMAGYMLNSTSDHCEEPVLLAIDLVAVSGMVVGIGVLAVGKIETGAWAILVSGLGLLVVYFAMSVLSTARVRKQSRLDQARLAESQKMEAIGRLTGGVAHDFNNLLTAVIGNLELSEVVEDAAEKAELACEARKAAQRAATLTAQLLAFAKRAPLSPQVIDLAAFLRRLHGQLMTELAGRGRLVLDTSVAADLRVDPGQLRVALLNLVRNAGEALEDTGEVRIDVWTAELPGTDRALEGLDLPPGFYVGLSICDTGRGVKPANLGRIAEPFFTTKPVGAGSGLGLSMARGFAEQSGGALVLASVEGEGTQVWLLFPRVDTTVIAPGPGEAWGAGSEIVQNQV